MLLVAIKFIDRKNPRNLELFFAGKPDHAGLCICMVEEALRPFVSTILLQVDSSL
jgi:hypothetical protein